MTVRSVVLAGGGTAGHVNPLLAVADGLRTRNPETALLVLGTETGLEADLVPARGYPLRPVPKVPLPRRPSADIFRLPGRLKTAIAAADAALTEIDADVVVGFGGYVSTPAYIAAHRRGIPIVVHEQNARPGLANRLGARWAARVGVTFPGTALRDAVVTGLPLRPEIADLIARRSSNADAVRVEAAAVLDLNPALPTILVTGGSLGAVSINGAVAGAARALLDSGAQILHLTGKNKDEAVRQGIRAATTGMLTSHAEGWDVSTLKHYYVRDYLPDMHYALACADLVIARAGAGTVCELAALGIPAVYVPLPIGNGEQFLNAAPLVAAGGGVLVDDAAFTSAWVADQVPDLLAGTAALTAMGRAAAEFGVRDGASRLVDLIDQAAAEGATR